MKAKFRFSSYGLSKMYLPVVLFLMSGLLLTNCKVNSGSAGNKSKGIRTLVVGGGSSHDFDKWYKGVDVETLRRDGLATVRYTSNTDSIDEYLPETDVLYFVTNQQINDPQARQAIFDFVNAGKGLVLGHAGMWYNWRDWPEFNAQVIGGGSRGHDRYGSYEVTINNPNHPVVKGVGQQRFTLKDERYYYNADPAGPGVDVLASSSVAGSDKIFPSVFVVKHPKARVVGIALGHDGESHNLPAYQTMLRNAVAWVAKK